MSRESAASLMAEAEPGQAVSCMAVSKSVRTETQVSAGGAVFRPGASGPEIALISVGTPPRWQLPKGIIDKGETPEHAAVREVREEAGIDAGIDRLIEKAEYWYQATESGGRVRYHKFVYFFSMAYIGGDVADHDDEVNEARWFSADEAIAMLTFRSEREIVEKAIAFAGETRS
jgi:8-oxo-dGTP pyrophosphatase MutT (NUDIX family)